VAATAGLDPNSEERKPDFSALGSLDGSAEVSIRAVDCGEGVAGFAGAMIAVG
jgi:hypothetical protein